jgi:tetratricopeptide (TPR) repeat protein/predicted Ser/Thr protein kinase
MTRPEVETLNGSDDAEMAGVLEAYLADLEAGRQPDPERVLAKHPHLADRLRRCLASLDVVGHVGRALTAESQAQAFPRLAGYEILRELGRGGMGVVYEARQKGLNRVVALKVILAGEFASESDIRRFRAEAEAVGALDHPHIVPVYEVGEDRGRHYFSMKRIDGGSLADRRNRLCDDPRSVAQLVAMIARAVDHAHQRGILHRDLKPSNILVDADGRPHITDFGLAKRVDRGGGDDATRTGALLGSPPYMAPEQVTGDKRAMTTATDVYGLGAILYTLLTGRPPFQGDSVVETLERVKAGNPDPPSGINRAIDADLEAICLKCLEQDPHRRYRSAAELADDLDRFLEDKPIRAKRPTHLERALRWTRRHTAIVGATMGILTVTVLALLINAVLVRREQRQTAAALKLAESRSRQARQAVDKMYTRVAEKWLVDQPGLRPLQREFLEDALAFYQEFAGQEDRDPEARIDQAAALRRVADIEDALNRHEDIERILLRVVALLEALDDVAPNNPRCREELAAAHLKLAWLHRIDGRIKEAGLRYNQALETYQSLTTQYPGRWDYEDGKGRCLIGLAVARFDVSELDEAIRLCLQARDVYQSMQGNQETRSQSIKGLSQVYHYLGFCLLPAGRFSEAEPHLRKAVELSALILAESSTSPILKHEHASNVERLAEALKFQGKCIEAETSLRTAIGIQEPLAEQLPESTDFRQDLALSLCELGAVLQQRGGRGDEIAETLRRSIKVSKELIALAPKLVFRRVILARALIELAALERDRGDQEASKLLLAEARSSMQPALAISPLDPHVKEVMAKLDPIQNGKDRIREGKANR